MYKNKSDSDFVCQIQLISIHVRLKCKNLIFYINNLSLLATKNPTMKIELPAFDKFDFKKVTFHAKAFNDFLSN